MRLSPEQSNEFQKTLASMSLPDLKEYVNGQSILLIALRAFNPFTEDKMRLARFELDKRERP